MNQNHPSPLLSLEMIGAVARITIRRAEKRNALNNELIDALRICFDTLPQAARAAVLCGDGSAFCAGLDLSDVRDNSTTEAVFHSRSWHAAFERISFGRVPVVVVLHGAVIGGGLELASACHIRVAEKSAFYALPEGTRGLFVGGGGSVRISRLVGVPTMTDLMLTGRVLTADEGHRVGISQYLVGEGEGIAKAMMLAEKIATNAPMTTYGVMHVLPRIADQSIQDGMVTEALMAAVAGSDPDTRGRLTSFLEAKENKVKPAH
jgi:enoyl-CoA hydratase/carnithine racemase